MNALLATRRDEKRSMHVLGWLWVVVALSTITTSILSKSSMDMDGHSRQASHQMATNITTRP